jgi:hypothetical protein
VSREQFEHTLIIMYREAWSIRSLSRYFCTSRNAIRRILRAHESRRNTGHDVLAKRLKRASKLDAFEPEMKRILAKYPGITAVRLLEELREAGYAGGITMLRERLADMRPPREPVMRFETPRLLQPHPQARGRLPILPRRAEGMPHDNEKTVVLRWEAGKPVFNPAFIAFITRYKCKPVELDFVERKQGLAIAGNSGTGKSHIAKALLLSGCARLYRCRYTTAAGTLTELMASRADNILPMKLKTYISPDILLIDKC